MRFFRRGKSKIMVCPTVAGASPTSAEITGGTDISNSIASIAGFGITNSPIVTPDLGTAFNTQIEGEDTVADSSFGLYDDDGPEGEAIRLLLAKGTETCLVLMPYGNTPTKRCEVWRVRVTGLNDGWTLDATAAQMTASFAITKQPAQDGVIPAAA